MKRNDMLLYADKSDLSNWIPVCNNVACEHDAGDIACNAYLGISPFWSKGNSIYYYADAIGYHCLDNDYIIRRNLDGTEPKPVYTSSDYESLGLASGTCAGNEDGFLDSCVFLLEDGSWNLRIVQTGEGGAEVLYSEVFPAGSSGMELPMPRIRHHAMSVRGDALIRSQIPLGELTAEEKANWEAFTENLYYHVHDGELLPLDVPETCVIDGSYLSGNHFFHYHVNDGFYYMDLSTGEEVKIAHAAYENGNGICIDGTMMIETTMDLPTLFREGKQAQLRYFDGKQWQELQLPENWTANHWFRLRAAASDRILFTVSDGRDTAPDGGERMTELAYVMIGEDEIHICQKFGFAG